MAAALYAFLSKIYVVLERFTCVSAYGEMPDHYTREAARVSSFRTTTSTAHSQIVGRPKSDFNEILLFREWVNIQPEASAWLHLQNHRMSRAPALRDTAQLRHRLLYVSTSRERGKNSEILPPEANVPLDSLAIQRTSRSTASRFLYRESRRWSGGDIDDYMYRRPASGEKIQTRSEFPAQPLPGSSAAAAAATSITICIDVPKFTAGGQHPAIHATTRVLPAGLTCSPPPSCRGAAATSMTICIAVPQCVKFLVPLLTRSAKGPEHRLVYVSASRQLCSIFGKKKGAGGHISTSARSQNCIFRFNHFAHSTTSRQHSFFLCSRERSCGTVRLSIAVTFNVQLFRSIGAQGEKRYFSGISGDIFGASTKPVGDKFL
ncbi:hypothetical protein C8R43DRAFT_953141 [Mycena crocata]|nr:hypothetical protein C8R43DRAFT_953138 [Mycena crocata]KAJ7147454.1 hypothetical protein C8R43DRAFT_953141 [Mycena crocata]